MKNLLLAILMVTAQWAHAKVSYNEANCHKETADEAKIKMEDMGWGQTLSQMKEKYTAVYEAGKRLELRAYVENGEFILPADNGQKIVLSENFINSVRSHIEMALTRKYVDHIFFSDMGHAHLFLEKNLYEEKVKGSDSKDRKFLYETMLNDKTTKFLYHTAEQLKMLGEDKKPVKDRKTQWRFYTRNLVGTNKPFVPLEVVYNETHSHNTARGESYEKDTYRYWGAGFDISASKDSCFEFKHQGNTYYFDISLYHVKYRDLSGY